MSQTRLFVIGLVGLLTGGLGCGPPTSTAFSTPVTLSGPGVSGDGFLDRVALGVWGDSPTSVYFVGGGRSVVIDGKAIPGLFMHWDGTNFTELGAVGPTLWWATGFGANDVWAAGEQGTVVHWNGSSLVVLTGLANATLAGIWGSSPQDMWAVGGTLGGDPPGENDVILHCTGDCEVKDNWKRVTPPIMSGLAYFKIWGAAADDIFLVALGGIIEHWDGTSWTVQKSNTTAPLLTVHGRSANDVYAVGGPPGTLLRSTDKGETWKPETGQTFNSGLAGVLAHPNGSLYVVGLSGQKFRRAADGKWTDYTLSDPPLSDIHAVWIDAGGENGFCVGGNYATPPTAVARRIGVITRIGKPIKPATLVRPF